ncbi:hypothetical protein AKO1_008172 [Acrasis kona]
MVDGVQTPRQLDMYDDCTMVASTDIFVVVIGGPSTAHILIKPTQTLGHMLDAYCKRYKINRSNVQTLHHKLIQLSDFSKTIEELCIGDGDSLVAQLNIEKEPNIQIDVQATNGKRTSFLIRRSTPLQKLFQRYCRDNAVLRRNVVFEFESRAIYGFSTPSDLNMKDQSVIFVKNK